jgi:hypothetical protein
MTRALRRHRNDHDARRAQRTYLRQAYPDGVVACDGETRPEEDPDENRVL